MFTKELRIFLIIPLFLHANLLALSCGLAAACASRIGSGTAFTCGTGSSGFAAALIIYIKAGAFENYSRTAENKAAEFLSAFGTYLKRIILHRLKSIKAVSAGFTFVFICWHFSFLTNNYRRSSISFLLII
jgi:hypothetical protein